MDTFNYWILDQNYTFFRTVIFACILWWELLGKIFNSLTLEVLDQAKQIEKLTHQPKELVNQKCDIFEWRRNDE